MTAAFIRKWQPQPTAQVSRGAKMVILGVKKGKSRSNYSAHLQSAGERCMPKKRNRLSKSFQLRKISPRRRVLFRGGKVKRNEKKRNRKEGVYANEHRTANNGSRLRGLEKGELVGDFGMSGERVKAGGKILNRAANQHGKNRGRGRMARSRIEGGKLSKGKMGSHKNSKKK